MESAGVFDRDQAAEMIRSVEGMRRKTLAASARTSPFPLVVFGLLALAAAPFGFITSRAWESGALALGLLVAFGLTDRHYQRQSVHPAPASRAPRTTADIVVLVVLILVFGRFVVGFLLGFIFLVPGMVGSNAMLLILWSAIGIFLGKRTRNNALALAGGFSMLSIGASVFIWNDHWEVVAAASYGVVFLVGALIARTHQRRAA